MPLLRELKIVGALYGLSALYCAAFAAWIFSWMATTRGWPFLVLPFLALLSPCFAFVLVTYGILRGRGWARPLGLVVSVGAIANMSWMLLPISGVVEYMWSHPDSYLMGAFLLSSFVLLVANALCIYYLTRPRVKQHLRTLSSRRKVQPLREIRMLAGLYCLSGLYCSLWVGWMLWFLAVVPGGWIFVIPPLTWVPWICFAFFYAAFGVLRGRGWARWLGLILSAGTIPLMLFAVLFGIPDILEYWFSGHALSFLDLLGLFSPLLLITNVPCLYYLTRSRVKAMFTQLE